jgi:UDP-2-acetamido-2-deoxy-ribo-hexuluronate aminotransferase
MKIDFIDLKRQQALIKPQLDARIAAVLAHGQYIMGPEIAELEARLVEFTGAEHCISVSSGTDALLLALMALDVKTGDEVITTPFTFISTAEVISLLGAVPVFVDIELDTFNLDPALLEAAITPKTKAIIPVSLYGQCANFQAINAIALKHGIPVIEDAAQSFGATHHGASSCNLSTIGCTSFFPSKPLGCYGDGGACFTNDEKLAAKMKSLRIHGQTKRYYHEYIGVNARMDTLQAGIVLAKLDIFPDEIHARQNIGSWYEAALDAAEVITPLIRPGNTTVYGQYTIRVKNRAELMAALNEQGVPTAVHYPTPLHLQPAYAYLGQGQGSFPISEQLAQEVMSLPMHPYLEKAEVEWIAERVVSVLSAVTTV